jgi:DtxR family Mn-dependent transcriptional regulator
LEHVLSEDLEDRIAASLPDTRRDPHGSPIPTKDGRIEVLNAVNLAQVPEGSHVMIAEVYDHDPGLLRYLGELGLYPGTTLTVLGREAFGGSLRFEMDGKELQLGEEAIPHVSVIIR